MTNPEARKVIEIIDKEIGLLRDIFSDNWENILHKNDIKPLLGLEVKDALQTCLSIMQDYEDIKDAFYEAEYLGRRISLQNGLCERRLVCAVTCDKKPEKGDDFIICGDFIRRKDALRKESK